MTPVTDPAVLAQLNAGLKPVTDPAILAQLNGEQAKPGGLEAFIRGAANAGTFNLADTIAAAGDATIPLDSGSSTAPTWMQRFQENRSKQRGETSSAQAAHPVISLAGNIAGGFANPVARALPAAQTLGGAIGQGAGLGAAYGAGGAISNQGGVGDVAKDAAIGGVTGGAIGGLFHGIGKLLLPATKTQAAQALEAEGVNPTVGQSLGGSAQRLEDSYTSIPIMGDAIKDQQRAGISDFNRAAYNRVLEPLGLKYSEDGPIGNQGVQKLGDLMNAAYKHAFDGATVDGSSPTFVDAGERALQEAKAVLPPERFKMVQDNVNRLINSKIDQDGVLSGGALIHAKNWLSEQARSAPNATVDERNVAAAYGDILDVLKQGVAEGDPDRASMLKAADTAYSRYVRVAHAASSNNASGKEGLFTPNQLGTSIRTLENSARKLGFAKGLAPMQDLAQAGQQTLSQTVPDSGTAMRSIFEHPVSALATSPAWAAGRLLYTNAGQRAAKAVLFGAPAARTAASRVPPLLLPGALGLIGSSATQTAP